MRKGILIGMAALVCAGLVAGTATAAKTKVKTKVTVANTGPGVYEGKVTAKKGCHKNRDVAVWHDTNGNGQIDGEPTDFLIGEAVSDAEGNYSVGGNQAPIGDNVIVSVKKDKRGRKICKPATAATTAG